MIMENSQTTRDCEDVTLLYEDDNDNGDDSNTNNESN